MDGIVVTRPGDPRCSFRLLHSMFRFRHRIFRNRLGWDVGSCDELEVDAFDVLRPFYIVSRTGCDDVNACWRILPTTGPYMLKDTFSELLGSEPAPRNRAIWELSRFAVDSRATLTEGVGKISPVTGGMIFSAWKFAQDHGIRQYVTVTTVAVERLFVRSGIPIRRFGDGLVVRFGGVRSVACCIDINDAFRNAIEQLVPVEAAAA